MYEQGEILGVIDRMEDAWAVLALDDGQQLNWPADRLPAAAHVGAAIVLRREPEPGPGGRKPEGTFQGRVCHRTPGAGLIICLGPQRLVWPTREQSLSGDAIAVRLYIDTADTTRRRAQVKRLAVDLFG